jgi:hypothetical protein
MLKGRKRNYTEPMKITDQGREQIQNRKVVQNIHARVSALTAMKVIHALDRGHVFGMIIAWVAAGNGLDHLPLFEDCSRLERFAHKHHIELQKLTPNLTATEMGEGYQHLLAESFAKDFGEPIAAVLPTKNKRPWDWIN